MRNVPFNPDTVADKHVGFFRKWLASSEAATYAALSAVSTGQKIQFKSSCWKQLKDWLLEHVFHGKCAYCESKYDGNANGAAEHYRPKGRVTDRDRLGRSSVVSRGVEHHPGYYWLAYKWWNIVPSCDKCNSGKGKVDQFPVAGDRVFSVDELQLPDERAELDAIEQPLLLHPYWDHPEHHLVFGAKGSIAARERSVRGQVTIDVCDLRREALAVDRAIKQEDALSVLRALLAELLLHSDPAPMASVLECRFYPRFLDPSKPFSGAVLAEAERFLSNLIEQMGGLRSGLSGSTH